MPVSTVPVSAVKLRRVILSESVDCDSCSTPLFDGEVAYIHDETFSTGCCMACARDAAVAKLALFDGSMPSEAL